jgi:hypothetical protein
LKDQGKLTEAEPYLREAVDRMRRLSGEDHPLTMKMTGNLASLLQAQGKLPAAEAMSRDTLERMRRVKGEGHADTAGAHLLLGEVLRDLTRYREAEEHLLLAEPVLRSAPGVQSARRRECVEALAVLYEKWNGAEAGRGYDARAAQWRVKLGAESSH